ncbi:MAG TPA: hypothetical protein DEQ20_00570 [Desulfobulbaceae bacterium]|nr:hypothetical protein [Desulfobulbaceae bacterium]
MANLYLIVLRQVSPCHILRQFRHALHDIELARGGQLVIATLEKGAEFCFYLGGGGAGGCFLG